MEFKKSKIKMGLALGGGSALGFAHIGILKAFEENGISPDFISGTSSGAIIGALYAFGVSFKDIEDEADRLEWKNLTKIHPTKMGITTSATLREILEKYIHKDADILDAKIPFSVITTDIESGAKIIFKSGNIIDAVVASTCLPGLFAPIYMNGCLLVDGGITENVPISPLKGMGADIIVAVNLLRYRKYLKPKNIIGVLVNSFDMINHRISSQPRFSDANILIEPNLSSYYMGDIYKWKEISNCGYQEALKHVLIIKGLLRQTSTERFWDSIKKIFSKK